MSETMIHATNKLRITNKINNDNYKFSFFECLTSHLKKLTNLRCKRSIVVLYNGLYREKTSIADKKETVYNVSTYLDNVEHNALINCHWTNCISMTGIGRDRVERSQLISNLVNENTTVQISIMNQQYVLDIFFALNFLNF